MKNAYFERRGEVPELQSDIGVRFQAVASELLSLSAYADFILRQAFPQTAAGEYLEFHAELRDIERKSASKSSGTLTFYINEASETDIELPEGIICSVKDKPFVQLKTTKKGTIWAGETEVSVKAEAVTAGADGNAAAESVTVMVNPPVGIAGVINKENFSGGCDEEGDSALRRRIVNSYSIPQLGYSQASVCEQILTIDEVLDCAVTFDGSHFNIAVRSKSGYIDLGLRGEIMDKLPVIQVSSITINLSEAEAKSFDLTVNAYLSAADKDRAADAIKEAVKNACGELRIGENLNLSRIAYAASSVDGVKYCELAGSDALDGTIYCDFNEYLSLESVEVNCYE